MAFPEMFDLTGKVALVTGAAGGLGTAFVEAMYEAGADVVCSDIDESALQVNVEKAKRAGRKALGIKCDVSNEQEVEKLFKQTVDSFGCLDILFNNAGIGDPKPTPVHEYPTEAWNKVLAVDLQGVFYCSREALKIMMQQRSGKIINVASVFSQVGSSTFLPVPAYTAAKGAVVSLTREMALEYAKHGITVNAITPGFYITNISGGALYKDAAALKKVTDLIPMDRVAKPHELKGAAIFLASAAADYVTGTMLIADGGFLAK